MEKMNTLWPNTSNETLIYSVKAEIQLIYRHFDVWTNDTLMWVQLMRLT